MTTEKKTSSIQKKLEKVSLNDRSDSGITLMVPEHDTALNDSDIETAVSNIISKLVYGCNLLVTELGSVC